MTDTEKKQLRVLILARRKAATEESVAKKRKDALSVQIVAAMEKAKLDNVEYADVLIRALLRQDNETVFDMARILNSVPVDKLLATKTLTRLSDEGFTKLIREIPEIATARSTVPKEKKTLVVEAYTPAVVK